MRRQIIREIIPCLLILVLIHTQVMTAFGETTDTYAAYAENSASEGVSEEIQKDSTEDNQGKEDAGGFDIEEPDRGQADAAEKVVTDEVETRALPEGAEENMEQEGRSVNIFFSSSYGADIRVYRSPCKTVNRVYGTNSQVTLENVKAGDVYSYRISRPGYYTVQTAFVLTQRDIDTGRRYISVSQDRIGGRGYEPRVVFRWSDEVENKLFKVSSLKNVDTSVLDTPAFSYRKAAHEFSDYEECIAYVKNNMGKNGHLYYLDEAQTLPVVIFSTEDFSGAATIEDALNLLKNDNKLKILYQAQIHGNEPGSGEGAMAVTKTLGRKGSAYLSNTDILLMPRVNYEGSRGYLRGSNGIDLNRDALAQKSVVTKQLHWLYNEIQPEVFIDGHEFDGKNYFLGTQDEQEILTGLDDIQMICVNNLNRDASVYTKERDIMKNTLSALDTKGFRTFLYKPSTDSKTSCSYARQHQSLTFLVESCGIGLGKNHLERRVLAQHDAVMSIIAEASSKSSSLKSTVKKARSKLISRGKTHSLSDAFVLQHGANPKDAYELKSLQYDYNGNVISEEGRTETFINTGYAVRKRSRPTAYIISKKSFYAPAVIRFLDEQGIKYKETKKKQKISVRQYTGSGTKAFMKKKKNITFVNGAYVIYMSQEHANIISALFEPDTANGDGNESLVQMGVIKRNSRKEFPIYRTEIKDPLKNLKYK